MANCPQISGPISTPPALYLDELGFPMKKKLAVEGTLLLLYYANLINGVNMFTGDKKGNKLSKKEAVKKIANEKDYQKRL